MLDLASNIETYPITPVVGLYKDTTGRVPFEQIQKQKFKITRKYGLLFPFNDAASWLKIVLTNRNPARKQWVLEWNNPMGESVDFYISKPNGTYQIKKMGNMKDLIGMIPGIGKAVKDIDINNKSFDGIEAIIKSMTPAERIDPSLLNGSRRKRIADGSGTNIQEVNKLIKQFEDMRKMMKMMSGSNMKNMMRNMPVKR
ncbi:MAG TPA: 7TM-DISM domain-containing protein [Bacteroidia bacterium]|nr:7TM-DISM domain-containing protein [Bacteroidia bacterium]